MVSVELRAFDDRRLTRELARVGGRVSKMSACLPGSHRLVLTVDGIEHPDTGVRKRDAA